MACHYRRGSLPSKLRKSWVCFQVRHLADPDPWKTTRRNWWVIVFGDSLLPGTEEPICQPYLLSKEFCGCLDLGCCGETEVRPTLWLLPPDLPPCGQQRGELESITSDYRALRAQVVVSILAAGQAKGCKEEGADTVCQQLVAELMSGTGFSFHDPGPYLRISICLGLMGCTSLSQAKVSLPAGWLSW